MVHVIKIITKIILFVFLWLLISDVPIGMFVLKDGGIYMLDDNYYVGGGWPGKLFKGSEPIREIKGEVDKFAVLEKAIIVRTNDGWFAINKKTRDVSKSFETVEMLKESLNFTFGDSQIINSRSWLNLRGFWFMLTTYALVGLIMFYVFKITSYGCKSVSHSLAKTAKSNTSVN